MSDHEQRLASLAWYLRMMPKHIRSDDGDHTLIADMAADTVDAAAARIRELEADLDAARAERDAFYMDYRMKCDEQTKALHVNLARVTEERNRALVDVLQAQAVTAVVDQHADALAAKLARCEELLRHAMHNTPTWQMAADYFGEPNE